MLFSMMKRLLLLCLVGLLAVSTLASCGQGGDPEDSDSETALESETETETETESETAAPAETEPIVSEVFLFAGSMITGVIDRTASEYEIPETVTAIDDEAFKDCVNLASIAIPDSVTEIGENAFEGCTSLKKVTLPSSLEEISEGLFKGCSSLAELRIPDTVILLYPSAFEGCDALFVKENGLTYVDRWVLDCDTDVEEVLWREGTIGLANSSFEGCAKLTSIVIPDTVKHVGFYVFDGCTSVVEASGPASVVCNLPKAKLQRVTVTSGTTIEQYSFQGCANLESVTLADTVVKIDEMAFGGCKSLTELTLPNSVTTLGISAFQGCTALQTLHLSENLTAIPMAAFAGCSALTAMAIPASVQTIAIQAFMGCNNLIERVDDVDYVDTWAIGGKNRIESVVLREGTVGVADEAFKEQKRLRTLVMSDTLLYIGNYSFEECGNLQSVTVSPVLKRIAFRSFHGCGALTSMTLPDTIETVKLESFTSSLLLRKTMYHATYVDRWVVSCANDKDFTVLLASTVGIGPNAFGETSALEIVYYEGTKEEFDAIRIDSAGNGVLSRVTIAFLSEEEPTGEGSYWHYVSGIPTLWE